MEQISSARCFGGQQNRFKHVSSALSCEMHFSVFLPPQASQGPVPVLVWLSGLTCTDENFIQKAGAQQYAAKHGLALVAPDTSPRGEGVPDDSDGSWDFGLGAGFYVNATQPPWGTHYRMVDYVVEELPALLGQHLPVDVSQQSIFGHSMGGHGALTLGLKNPDKYRSVSAFSPITSPKNCPWGQKALSHYLGQDESSWNDYDACELIRRGSDPMPVLVDQGEADSFLESQLKPDLLRQAAAQANFDVVLRMQKGYDHSYFFIASFIGEHIAFHAKHLRHWLKRKCEQR